MLANAIKFTPSGGRIEVKVERVEDRTRALSAGFNMFVPKPVQPDELLNAIANIAEVTLD